MVQLPAGHRLTCAPDKWFNCPQVIAANERFPGIAGLLTREVPRLAIDTTSANPAEVDEHVRTFLGVPSWKGAPWTGPSSDNSTQGRTVSVWFVTGC
jgi:hypothetical protein